jgi:hypothetical protein
MTGIYRERGLARAGRHVEHPITRLNLGRRDHQRDEEP